MTSPRHLWSGDWELDSAAAREELAKPRAQTDEPAGDAPTPAAPPPRARPRARPRGRPRGRRLRIALLAVLVGILSAGAAYGVTTLVFGSTSASGHPYLGIDVVGSPLGIVVTEVAPGSPAAKAGLQPGDLLTAIDNQPVSTVDDVGAALDRLHAGDKTEISYSLGAMSYTAQAKVTSRPPGYP